MLYFKQRLIRKLECTFPDAPKSIEASKCSREYPCTFTLLLTDACHSGRLHWILAFQPLLS